MCEMRRWLGVTLVCVLAACGSSPPPEPPAEPKAAEPKMPDPREVGLEELLAEPQGDTHSIAEMLNGDMDGMEEKLAVAMGGEGTEFIVGPSREGAGAGAGVIGPVPEQAPRALIAFRAFAIQGPCAKSNAESVVRRRAGVLRACYEQRLGQVAGVAKGSLDATWTIDLEGGTTTVAVSGTIADAAIRDCAASHLRRTRFAVPSALCRVSVTLDFEPLPQD